MEKWTRLSAEQRENLVAYLDGELEDNLTQQIDRVLVQSEVARHEVEALARTWEMLDLLPKPNAPQDFTERTLHTLQVSEMRIRLVDQPWFGYVRKGAVAVLWAVGLAACAAIGFAITTRGIPNEHEDLLTNLPVVKNVDVYLEVRDLGFATDLQRAGVFNVTDAKETPAPPRRLEISKPSSSKHAVLEERSNEIAKMTASERRRIQYNWTTFQALAPAEQAEIRALHAQLEEQPDSLHALLDTYAMWLQTLTPGQRDDLRRATSSADRLRLVREFKEKQDANRETQLFDLNLDLQRMKPRMPQTPYLGEPDLAAVMDVLQRTMPQPLPRNLSPTERYIQIFRNYKNYPWGSQRQLSDEQLREVVDAITDEESKQFLNSRTSPDQLRFGVMMLIGKGLHAHVLRKLEPLYPDEKQLREFWATLDSVRREELMAPKRKEDAENPSYLTSELMHDYFKKLELDKPDLKPLLDYWLQLRGFPRPPAPPGGSGRVFRGFSGGRPPGDRPPEDESGARGEQRPPGGPRPNNPPPVPSERVYKPPQ